jgi:hypothetical protein
MSKNKNKSRKIVIKKIVIRNLGVVALVNRGGKGPHKNKKKKLDKEKCRGKVPSDS